MGHFLAVYGPFGLITKPRLKPSGWIGERLPITPRYTKADRISQRQVRKSNELSLIDQGSDHGVPPECEALVGLGGGQQDSVLGKPWPSETMAGY